MQPPAAVGSGGGGGGDGGSVKERLQALQELVDDGLISEAEFAEKRQQILAALVQG